MAVSVLALSLCMNFAIGALPASEQGRDCAMVRTDVGHAASLAAQQDEPVALSQDTPDSAQHPATSDTTAEPQDNDTITVVGTYAGPPESDPLIQLNEQVFDVASDVDAALVEPVSEAYEEAVPSRLRRALDNVLNNLFEPVNALHFLLQGKPGKTAETLGRFAINSTVGIGGIVDVAKKEPFNLPRRRNGLGNTLGFYGVGPGPYLVVPLVGSTSLRDLFGVTVDNLTIPALVGAPFNKPAYVIPTAIVDQLNDRVAMDGELDRIRETDDPYTSMREYYLCRREAEINELKGRVLPCSLLDAEDELAEDEE